jgi:hypothetical protein
LFKLLFPQAIFILQYFIGLLSCAQKFCKFVFFSENKWAQATLTGKLHNFGACGKAVSAMCIDSGAFVHFSLARKRPIGDNPAL